MTDPNEIVYLESRLDRFKGRWRAMSRIARMGIVSIIFGSIGLLGCFFLRFIPFLSLPFSAIGLVIGGIAFVLGFVKNLRRDGFWFPLTGTVLSLLGLALAFGNWNNYLDDREQRKQQEIQAELQRDQERYVGRWLKDNGESQQPQQSLEMTAAGSLLWRGPERGESAEATVARYQLKGSYLVISFGEEGGQNARSIVRYNVDTSRKDTLLLSDRRVVSGGAVIDMGGVWKRVGPPRILTEAEKKAADYQSKLDRFRTQLESINELIASFDQQRQQLLEKLRPYEEQGETRDESWTVWARELDKLLEQIELLERRRPTLEQTVVMLEAAIGRLTRQAKLDRTEINSGQLEQLLMDHDELESELKSMQVREEVEEFVLQQTVTEELGKEKARAGGN